LYQEVSTEELHKAAQAILTEENCSELFYKAKQQAAA